MLQHQHTNNRKTLDTAMSLSCGKLSEDVVAELEPTDVDDLQDLPDPTLHAYERNTSCCGVDVKGSIYGHILGYQAQ